MDVKYIPASNIGYTFSSGIYESSDNNFMLKSLLPNDVKINITIDDIKVKSNLTTCKTFRFTKKLFFFIIFGFMQSHSGTLGDIAGFVQLIPRSYISDKPINITGIDKIHLK